ncbi:cytochrome c oxidase subunit 3 [Pollutimonas bauzanensis]|uniref:Cytochrome c oxidase subunit 3 n=1 Tax=Pollutimonas bauzanensis TaxID=658167 RepID=A0A1M5WA43_9BURK|nr:cytochrome c oxidase subunit 3 [Pollutimonas bauzanensis]SHH84337.1 cytochrome c oxidase subunit 3 [Pollutimonas bauzanensis]
MSSDAARIEQDQRSRLGMWIFLASEIMFFGPIFFAYAVGRYEMPDAFAQAGRSTDIVSGSINTAILLTSSLSIALGLEFARTGARKAACRAFDITVLLALCFLFLKGNEYLQDSHEHLIPGPGFHLAHGTDQQGAELFYFIYFASTLLHALHLAIGIALVLAARLHYSRVPGCAAMRRLDATGLYWHFVDIIWIFLFPALYLIGRAP